MMPGSFLVLNIWAGSLFSTRVSAAFQIYSKCKSNNTRELQAEHPPGPIASLASWPLLGAHARRTGALSPARPRRWCEPGPRPPCCGPRLGSCAGKGVVWGGGAEPTQSPVPAARGRTCARSCRLEPGDQKSVV